MGVETSLVARYGQRIRAARSYAGLSQRELGEALGIDEQTIKRREADKQAPKDGELMAIAQICGVPLGFLRQGFAAAESIAATSEPGGDKLDTILTEVRRENDHIADIARSRNAQHAEIVQAFAQLDREVRRNGDDLRAAVQELRGAFAELQAEQLRHAARVMAALQQPSDTRKRKAPPR